MESEQKKSRQRRQENLIKWQQVLRTIIVVQMSTTIASKEDITRSRSFSKLAVLIDFIISITHCARRAHTCTSTVHTLVGCMLRGIENYFPSWFRRFIFDKRNHCISRPLTMPFLWFPRFAHSHRCESFFLNCTFTWWSRCIQSMVDGRRTCINFYHFQFAEVGPIKSATELRAPIEIVAVCVHGREPGIQSTRRVIWHFIYLFRFQVVCSMIESAIAARCRLLLSTRFFIRLQRSMESFIPSTYSTSSTLPAQFRSFFFSFVLFFLRNFRVSFLLCIDDGRCGADVFCIICRHKVNGSQLCQSIHRLWERFFYLRPFSQLHGTAVTTVVAKHYTNQQMHDLCTRHVSVCVCVRACSSTRTDVPVTIRSMHCAVCCMLIHIQCRRVGWISFE